MKRGPLLCSSERQENKSWLIKTFILSETVDTYTFYNTCFSDDPYFCKRSISTRARLYFPTRLAYKTSSFNKTDFSLQQQHLQLFFYVSEQSPHVYAVLIGAHVQPDQALFRGRRGRGSYCISHPLSRVSLVSPPPFSLSFSPCVSRVPSFLLFYTIYSAYAPLDSALSSARTGGSQQTVSKFKSEKINWFAMNSRWFERTIARTCHHWFRIDA